MDGHRPQRRCALLLLKAMTEMRVQMLHSYFRAGQRRWPAAEGAVSLAGFVPGVPRLGIRRSSRPMPVSA